ncbi:hypothetical protein HWV62_26280 [Athelia sp. TMB]|nr:hypothetical protein HWV62_26280 [Athelia sp. TMB]
MTGPPTPPLTTATEMADASRTPVPAPVEPSAPIAVPSPAASAPAELTPPPKQIAQTSYELLFPTLSNLAHQGNYRQLISAAEFGDLKADDDRHPTRLLLIAPLVLAYLIEDDLPPAKLVLSRLSPEKLGSLPLAQALLGLLASTWEKKYDHIYSRVEYLTNNAQQAQFAEPKLGEVITIMVKAFAALGDLGWTYDASSETLTPPAEGAASSIPTATQGPSSLHKFNLMADSTARLEL